MFLLGRYWRDQARLQADLQANQQKAQQEIAIENARAQNQLSLERQKADHAMQLEAIREQARAEAAQTQAAAAVMNRRPL